MVDQAGFVLDGSVALAWYFQDEADVYADSVRDSLDVIEAAVPSLWTLEIANVMIVGERRKRSTEAQATAWLGLLRGLPIHIDGETASSVWDRTMPLARTWGLSVYDATYLELALRLGVPIATLDGKLKSAASAAGVPLYVVATT